MDWEHVTIFLSTKDDLIKQSIQQDRDQLIFFNQNLTQMRISDGIFWRKYDHSVEKTGT